VVWVVSQYNRTWKTYPPQGRRTTLCLGFEIFVSGTFSKTFLFQELSPKLFCLRNFLQNFFVSGTFSKTFLSQELSPNVFVSGTFSKFFFEFSNPPNIFLNFQILQIFF